MPDRDRVAAIEDRTQAQKEQASTEFGDLLTTLEHDLAYVTDQLAEVCSGTELTQSVSNLHRFMYSVLELKW